MRRKAERKAMIKRQNQGENARHAWIKAGRPEQLKLDSTINCFWFRSWAWFTKKNCKVISGTFFV